MSGIKITIKNLMIKLILKGGLGNQMFQYAFAKSVAIETNQELVLDTSFLDNRIPIKDFTVRHFELDLFNIPEKKIKTFKIDLLQKYLSYPLALFLNKFNKSYLLEGLDFYKFDEDLYNKAITISNPVIEGYFNNYNYFNKYEKEIKEVFNTDKLYDSNFDEIEQQIKNTNSVSINIRRGDYTNFKHKDVFVFLDENYYKQAIDIIREKVENPHFYIFSIDFPANDDSYFINNLGLARSEITLLDKSYTGERFKTYLRLISLCKHNIMANSTFSFWGGYLNKNNAKVVISPKRWVNRLSNFNIPISWLGL